MIKLRQIQADDTDEVKGLIDGIMNDEFASQTDHYNYQDLEDLPQHYGGNREIFLVGEDDDNIVGTVAIKEDGPGTAMLRRIFVRKDQRGKGYGAKLLNKAMEFCFDHDYKNVTFRGTDKMQTALQLCLKNGFEEHDVAEIGDVKLIQLNKDLR